jgi:hypothetical protein
MEVSFVTLLLGLVTGVHPVSVAVTGPVAAVELRLDGAKVGVASGPPWTVRCDFGHALRPHKLEAIATASDGRALDTTVQWVNVPRPRAEVSLSLESERNSPPTAVLVSWNSLEFDRPKRIEATLDGAPIAAPDSRIALPKNLGASTHLFTVRAVFPHGVIATSELAFGGAIGEEASTELTAVPIVFPWNRDPPSPNEMSGWLEARGQPLSVVAVERGAAEVVIVRDFGAGDLRDRWRGQLVGGNLAVRDAARLLLPGASEKRRSDETVFLFDLSPRYLGSEVGIPWILASLEPDAGAGKRQSLADAVCVAALHAAGNNAPRSVVLVLGNARDDQSEHGVAAARSYLRDLRVPLVVWTVDDGQNPSTAEWLAHGHAPILNYGQLGRAVRELRSALADQAIVWVRGRHLPQDIRATKLGAALRFVGS